MSSINDSAIYSLVIQQETPSSITYIHVLLSL